MIPVNPTAIHIAMLCAIVLQLVIIAWLNDRLAAERRRSRCKACRGIDRSTGTGFCAVCGDVWRGGAA